MFKVIATLFTLSFLWISSISNAATRIIDDPTGMPSNADSINLLVARLQEIVSGAAFGIAVIIFFWGSLLLITAGGNEEKITKGKKILTYAIVGIGLIILANLFIISLVQLLGGDVTS
jgi:tetrahydromethanopterin S-methyltransferase subunit E